MSQPYKVILCIDFETRWSSKPCEWSPDEAYTLSKRTTEEYIRDPRFKAFGACIQGNGVAVVIVHVDVGRAEMLHIGGHNEVASLLKAGFQQYMFENNPRESGVVLQ